MCIHSQLADRSVLLCAEYYTAQVVGRDGDSGARGCNRPCMNARIRYVCESQPCMLSSGPFIHAARVIHRAVTTRAAARSRLGRPPARARSPPCSSVRDTHASLASAMQLRAYQYIGKTEVKLVIHAVARSTIYIQKSDVVPRAPCTAPSAQPTSIASPCTAAGSSTNRDSLVLVG